MEKLTFKQRMDSFGKFIWNGEEGQLLGRGCRSWGEIGLFYLIYYICLTGFFAATIAVFYQTIDEDQPALTGSSSLLKGNPGVGVRPRPGEGDIYIKSSDVPKEYKKYFDSTKDTLKSYEKSDLQNIDCSGETKPRPKESTPCAVDMGNLTTDCNENNAYGMADGTPCVLLKLNKVYGWTPDMWEEDDLKDSGLPDDLKSVYRKDQVWINCKGRKGGDQKHMENAKIEYFPSQGFPVAFFPYKKQKDYLAPLVFVKFSNLTVETTIKIECRAFAKNIHLDRTEKQGAVEFELNVKK